ncbi:MAG TPA: hypothetical protein VLG50_05460 [Candidatus Saccharimonadales bacterium]|nr:hypothetical protein [Candidatus Saccharimonadales bacterium]
MDIDKDIIMLFQQGNICSDAGGQADQVDKDTAETASRECREESANLLYFSPETLRQCPTWIDKSKKKWSCYYFVDIDILGIDLSLFYTNRKILQKLKAPQQWKEKQHIRLFNLSTLDDNHNCKIAHKIKSIVQMIDHIQIPYIDMMDSGVNKYANESFLQNTYTYTF